MREIARKVKRLNRARRPRKIKIREKKMKMSEREKKMKISEWEEEIEGLHPDTAKEMAQAIGLLLCWPVFKREFEELESLQKLMHIRSNFTNA